MNETEAAEKPGTALQSSFDGMIELGERMDRPLPRYTWWELRRIHLWYWLGKDWWAQRIMLEAMARQHKG